MKNTLQNAAIVIGTSLVLAALLLTNIAGIAFTASTNTVAASVSIPNNCITALSNTVIAFGTVIPGSNAPTANAVNVINDGNVQANILISGTTWTYLSNTFDVGNTVWDFSSHAAVIKGNALASSATDTFVQIGVSAGQNLFFGTNVPTAQAGGTYAQTITIENGC